MQEMWKDSKRKLTERVINIGKLKENFLLEYIDLVDKIYIFEPLNVIEMKSKLNLIYLLSLYGKIQRF